MIRLFLPLLLGLTFCTSASLESPEFVGQPGVRARIQPAVDSGLDVNKKRLVELIGVVGKNAVDEVAVSIYGMTRKDRTKPIWMLINSPGGSVYSGTVVLDAMALAQESGITIKCLSGVLAASMGFVILSKCDERYTLPTTRLLFHPMSVSTRGAQVTHLHTNLGTTIDEENYLKELQRSALNFSEEHFERHYQAETFWDARQLRALSPQFITIVRNVWGVKNLFEYRRESNLRWKLPDNYPEVLRTYIEEE
jgi:ATP-dependent Clp protease, protease subunit